MSASQPTPYKRHKTKRSGVTFRVRSDGSRTWAVYFQGKQRAVGESDYPDNFDGACQYQDDLRGKRNRGEKIVTTKHAFAEAAEAAFELNKGRWNERVRQNYRASLDNYVVPHFNGYLKDYDWESIIEFRQTLEAKGLSGWTIRNVLKPVRLTFAYAMKKRWIGHNPVNDLEREDGVTVAAREVRIPSEAERTSCLPPRPRKGCVSLWNSASMVCGRARFLG